jgi:hypothetical protein
MYLPFAVSTPIFFGGLIRWGADKVRGVSASEAETETSPGVLLSSGYIAGGTVCGLIIAFFTFLPYTFQRTIDVSHILGEATSEDTKAVDEARKKGVEEEAIALNDVQRAERKEETQKAVDSIHSETWLETLAAKILVLIAFGVLSIILFWQGVQKPPKEPSGTSPPGPRTE